MKREISIFQVMVGIGLSVMVMLMINALVGGLGGMPAMVGVFSMYSLLRFFHQEKDKLTKEIKIMMLQYGMGYLLIWAGMNVVVYLSRISGWGSVDGVTIGSHLSAMLGSSLLEKWAYFFAGALMFVFVMSLFPLVVIRRWKIWVLYAIADGGIFTLICGGIAAVCQNFFIADERKHRGNCVLDDLLMCQITQRWQAVLFFVGVLLLLALVLFISYYISKINYGKVEKPGKIVRIRENLLIPIIVVLLLVAGGMGYFFFGDSSESLSYQKIAECLTKDTNLGPMIYDGNVYLPAKEESWSEERIPLGYLAYKGQKCDSRFYELAVGNILYAESGTLKRKSWMEGAKRNFYLLAEDVEQQENWKNDDIFLLWDEAWENQSSYSAGFTGYTVCSSQLVTSLKEEYPVVEYKEADFEEYDAYFTLQGYEVMPEGLEESGAMGHWVGCILVKDNKFYFGNMQNPIVGDTLELLLDVLGGYEHSQNMISTQGTE